MPDGALGLNREHRDDCPLFAHGQPTATFGGLGIGWATAHEDGTVFVTTSISGQRQPYRLDPSRDGDGLRSHERGRHGQRARAAAAWLGWQLVKRDRRGGSIGLSDVERERIVQHVETRVGRGSRVTQACHEVAGQVGRGYRTVLDVWRARNQLRDQRGAGTDPGE